MTGVVTFKGLAVHMLCLTHIAAGITGIITVGCKFMGFLALLVGAVKTLLPVTFVILPPHGVVHMPGIGRDSANLTG